MKNFRAAVIGLSLFVVFAIGVTTLVYGTLRRDTTGSTKSYSAIFTDVTGVRVGDDVRIAAGPQLARLMVSDEGSFYQNVEEKLFDRRDAR